MLNRLNGMCYRNGMQISEDEYTEACQVVRCKAALARSVYSEEISMDDVPTEWKGDVQKLIDARAEAEQMQELPETEQKAAAYDILMGVSE